MIKKQLKDSALAYYLLSRVLFVYSTED